MRSIKSSSVEPGGASSIMSVALAMMLISRLLKSWAIPPDRVRFEQAAKPVLALPQSLLRPVTLRDVARKLGCADHAAARVEDRRHRQRHGNLQAILPAAHGFILHDALAAANPLQNFGRI